MRTSINHAVYRIIVRQIITVFSGIKRKLDQFHARESGILYHLDHRRSQITEIFHDDVQFAEFFFQCAEKIHARSFSPLTVSCRLIFSRNRIIGIKSTEMIDTDNII